jgi:nanoRNase/pAp phosphatase (c-di-AMP/oligoRNAs hydrolase)
MADDTLHVKKIEEFRQRMLGATSVLILAHDFPDPDCLASAYGLQHLLAFWHIGPVTISFGGFVGRAENRAMVRFLHIESVPFMLINPKDYDRIVLVDSFPGLGNLSLSKEVTIDAVLDHHPHDPGPGAPFFHDIRKNLGSTSTLVTMYLLAAQCPVSSDLATALFYGIKTDTNEMARNAAPDDLECYKLLFDKIDHRLLSRIEWPERDAEYFRILHSSVEAMVMYRNVGYTHLGLVSTPDHLAEIADLLYSLQTIDWMICSGIFKSQLFYSVRSKDSGGAGDIAERIALSLGGSGGGHSAMAAVRIPLNGAPQETALQKFVRAVQDILNVSGAEGRRLLQK